MAAPGLEILLKQATVYLGLGGNLGDRRENLANAVQALDAGGELTVLRTSGIYETAPWGLTDQPDFLNMVVEIATTLSPRKLLDFVKAVEKELGRQAGPRFGPRLIDIDLLLYGDQVVDEPDLQIPHASLHVRAFALVPLAELAPSYLHPVLAETIGDLARRVDGLDGIRPAD